MNNEDLTKELEIVNNKIVDLTRHIKRLENILRTNQLPSTNVVSESFLTRAFAIYGHSLVAGLILMIPIYILIFIIFFFSTGIFERIA